MKGLFRSTKDCLMVPELLVHNTHFLALPLWYLMPKCLGDHEPWENVQSMYSIQED